MSNTVSLSTFPSNKNEALTMLYLQNQDLSDLTPEQIVDKYNETFKAIKKRFSEIRSENRVLY